MATTTTMTMRNLASTASANARPTARLLATAAPSSRMQRSAFTSSASQLKGASSLMSMGDLSVKAIGENLSTATKFRQSVRNDASNVDQTLTGKTVALLFTKRSTRTRVATETSVAHLGGSPMFLGPSDIQLGVNETLYDTSKVLGSMVGGIVARVDKHEDVQTLAKYSNVPVINALSDLYHPTQILADLMTLVSMARRHREQGLLPPLTGAAKDDPTGLSGLVGLNVAWVGDSNNIINDMLLAFPRLGINLSVATPKGYELDSRVRKAMEAQSQSGGNDAPNAVPLKGWFHDPLEAVKGAHVIVTDTWISMGDEASKEQRLRDFAGFQVTRDMAQRGGADPNWRFMHCLPRKQQEVDDDVFYDEERSLVWEEAENRKWTIMALADAMFRNNKQ